MNTNHLLQAVGRRFRINNYCCSFLGFNSASKRHFLCRHNITDEIYSDNCLRLPHPTRTTGGSIECWFSQ